MAGKQTTTSTPESGQDIPRDQTTGKFQPQNGLRSEDVIELVELKKMLEDTRNELGDQRMYQKNMSEDVRAILDRMKKVEESEIEVFFEGLSHLNQSDKKKAAKIIRDVANGDANQLEKLVHWFEETKVGGWAKAAHRAAAYGVLATGAGYGVYKGFRAVVRIIRGDAAGAMQEGAGVLDALSD